MRITLNATPLELEIKETDKLGDILATIDELADKAGSVIVSLKIDGKEIDAELYSSCSEKCAGEVALVEVQAEDAAAVKLRAMETLIELLAIAKSSAEAAANAGAAADWPGIRESAVDMRDAFAGLFAADELSFVQFFSDLLARSGDEPDAAAGAEIADQADRIAAIFGERLAELREPVAEMRAAAAIFEGRSSELADIPVLLQTGKEGEAMKTVLFFIEIFNKVIRIIPELRRHGVDTSSIEIAGAPMPQFYGDFNKVLRELTEAFEHKDAVLIGDLAEYEILPRMTSFFGAMKETLPES
jgi:hypothetical protein